MASIKFTLRASTRLDEHEARDLAELLLRQRNLAARSAANKILEQTNRNVGEGETSDVTLDRDELQAVLNVLSEGVPEADTPATIHLRESIAYQLRGA